MKNLFFFLIIAAFAATGCNNTAEKKPESSAGSAADGQAVTAKDTAKTPEPTLVGGTTTTCYQLVEKDKTVHTCTIDTRATPNPFVGGYCDWAPYEKDGGHGILKNGVIEKGMLTADWVYMIEGSVQAEEVYFKIEGDKLTKMEAPLEDKKGKMVAKDKTKLKAKEVFVKVDCAKTKDVVDGIKAFEKNLVMPK